MVDGLVGSEAPFALTESAGVRFPVEELKTAFCFLFPVFLAFLSVAESARSRVSKVAMEDRRVNWNA